MLERLKKIELPQRGRIVRTLWWLGLVAIALVGVIFVLRATTLGVGVSPDSTAYISMARGMLIRFGFSFVLQASDDFPPFYPALLAAGGAVTGDPATAARWINALLFGGNILLIGWILKQILRQSFWAPLVGAGLMLTSVSIVMIHAMAWSEPAFLFLGMSGLIALARYVERLERRWLLVSAGAIGLAAMDRYVGISLVVTGISVLLLLTPGSLRRKLGSAVVFAAIAFLPLSAWLTYRPTRRMLTFQVPLQDYFQSGIDTLSLWIVQGTNPFLAAARPWIIVGLAILLALGVWYVWRRKTRQLPPQVLLARVPSLFYIVTLFLVLYPLAHLAAKVFFSPSISLHARALSPVFVSGVIFFVSLASTILHSIRPGSLVLRIAAAALTLAIISSTFNNAWRYVQRIRVEGLGYNSIAWHASPTIARIRTLPPDLAIYSNGSDAIYFLTGRIVHRTPDLVDKMNMIDNQTFLAEMKKVRDNLAAGRAVIVYMNNFPDRWYQPSEQDLMSVLPLHLIAREADGAMFQ